MLDARTCSQCGHRMTTGQLWRRLMTTFGWRVACPACGRVHDIPMRERFISALYYAVGPGILSAIALGLVTLPMDHTQRGVILIGSYLMFATLGTWFGARRLRLG